MYVCMYVCMYVTMCVRVKSYNSILRHLPSTDWAEILHTCLVWMTMHVKLCDVILNPTWLTIQDGGLVIFKVPIQYGYQMKGIDK